MTDGSARRVFILYADILQAHFPQTIAVPGTKIIIYTQCSYFAVYAFGRTTFIELAVLYRSDYI